MLLFVLVRPFILAAVRFSKQHARCLFYLLDRIFCRRAVRFVLQLQMTSKRGLKSRYLCSENKRLNGKWSQWFFACSLAFGPVLLTSFCFSLHNLHFKHRTILFSLGDSWSQLELFKHDMKIGHAWGHEVMLCANALGPRQNVFIDKIWSSLLITPYVFSNFCFVFSLTLKFYFHTGFDLFVLEIFLFST